MVEKLFLVGTILFLIAGVLNLIRILNAPNRCARVLLAGDLTDKIRAIMYLLRFPRRRVLRMVPLVAALVTDYGEDEYLRCLAAEFLRELGPEAVKRSLPCLIWTAKDVLDIRAVRQAAMRALSVYPCPEVRSALEDISFLEEYPETRRAAEAALKAVKESHRIAQSP